MKNFDLNIDKILENWEVFHAVRELIANAIDEQILTNPPTPALSPLRRREGVGAVSRCPRGRASAKRLDGAVKADTLLTNGTEWPATVAGRMSHGKCRLNTARFCFHNQK
jgi:hypothetical protein